MGDWRGMAAGSCGRVSIGVISHPWRSTDRYSIIPLYYLIRRPTHILDFSLTLLFNHLIFTTYYAGAFPASLYFWIIQALSALIMVVVAEQVSLFCPKR
jgi:hypothetical protein